MKCLVTGGNGFIGSNLVDKLIELNHDVVVLDNLSSEAHDKFYFNEKATNVVVDICDYEQSKKFYSGVDVVFHMAAESRIESCIQNPLQATKTNVLGTATVLQCAKECGVKRFVYSSTSAAYGSNTSPLDEEMPTDCLNPYATTKVAGEELCKIYRKLYGLETVIFRYFNVYGERQPSKGAYATVIGIFLRNNKNNEPLTIVGDGEQRRDFIHVKDIVDANIKASTFRENAALHQFGIDPFGQIYNVGSGINYSVNEIASMIGGKSIKIPQRKGEAKSTLSVNTKIFDTFSWMPSINLKDWITNENFYSDRI